MKTSHHTSTTADSLPSIPTFPKVFRALAIASFCALCVLSVSPALAEENPQSVQFAEKESDKTVLYMQRGDEALAARDYETAFAEYRLALDLERRPDSDPLRNVALDRFTQAGLGLTEWRMAEGRWQDAEDTIRTILQPEYNPGDQTAQKLLMQLEDPSYFNKTITPEFVYQVEVVKSLLNAAGGLFDSGRFDEAKKAFDSVLELDPYNVTAWQGIERINKAKRRVADIARKANAPLMPEHSQKPVEWLPMGLLGLLVLISLALIFRGLFTSTALNGLENGKTGSGSLLPLGWFVLAFALLAFTVIATRYQIIFSPEQNDQRVLKVDRWTGSVEWLAD